MYFKHFLSRLRQKIRIVRCGSFLFLRCHFAEFCRRVGKIAAVGQGIFRHFGENGEICKKGFTNANGCSIIQAQPTPVSIKIAQGTLIFLGK